jgi:hypothetical protein
MTAANQILGSEFYQVYIIYTNRKIISIYLGAWLAE